MIDLNQKNKMIDIYVQYLAYHGRIFEAMDILNHYDNANLFELMQSKIEQIGNCEVDF